MLRTLGQTIVAVLLVATAAAVLFVSPLARPAVALLPSFVATVLALLMTH